MSKTLSKNNLGAVTALVGMMGFVSLLFPSAVSATGTSTNTAGDIQHTYVSVSSGRNISLNVNPNNTLQEATDSISVSSNTNNGYKVYVSMSSNTANANRLYLDGTTTEDSTKFIAPLTTPTNASNFPANSWGISTDTGTNRTYQGIPLKGQELLLKSFDSSTPSATLPIYYGVKANTSLVAGNYTGTIVYTVLANDTTATQITPTTTAHTGGATLTIDTPMLYMPDIIPTATVTIGGTTCTNPTVQMDENTGHTQVTCTIPAKDPGSYDVVVTYTGLQNNEEKTFTATTQLTYEVPYHITSVSPSTVAASGGDIITIKTDIPNASTKTISSVKIGSSTCTSPVAREDGNNTKITCTVPSIAEGTYDIAININVDSFNMSMGATQAITATNTITATIPWMYPTNIPTTGTQDKLVIATKEYNPATTDTVTVDVDGTSCENPQIVNGGYMVYSSSRFFKLITCTPPAMSAGSHDVTATITHGTTTYTFNNKAINYTTGTITNRLTSIPDLEMQNISQLDTETGSPDTTKTFCANSTTPTLGDAIELVPEVKLTDARDDQEYTVRKLADGNCWMTENLRYGSTIANAKRAYQSSDETLSDNVNDAKMSELTVDRIATGSNPGAGWFDNNTDNYEKPQIMIYQANTTNTTDSSYNNTKYGVLYNYCAATGGTVCNNEAMSSAAAGSVCPANWKLPGMTGHPTSTDSTATAKKDGSVKTYNNLLNNYNINYRGNVYDSEYSKLVTNSLDFVRAGGAVNGSLYGRSASGSGNYWASTANSGSNYAYLLLFNSGYVLRGSLYRYRGNSVRCVAS